MHASRSLHASHGIKLCVHHVLACITVRTQLHMHRYGAVLKGLHGEERACTARQQLHLMRTTHACNPRDLQLDMLVHRMGSFAPSHTYWYMQQPSSPVTRSTHLTPLVAPGPAPASGSSAWSCWVRTGACLGSHLALGRPPARCYGTRATAAAACQLPDQLPPLRMQMLAAQVAGPRYWLCSSRPLRVRLACAHAHAHASPMQRSRPMPERAQYRRRGCRTSMHHSVWLCNARKMGLERGLPCRRSERW